VELEDEEEEEEGGERKGRLEGSERESGTVARGTSGAVFRFLFLERFIEDEEGEGRGDWCSVIREGETGGAGEDGEGGGGEEEEWSQG